MTSTLLFLVLSTTLGQAGNQPDGGEWVLTPQLAPGVELVYSGTTTEESLLAGVQYHRTYRIDNQLLVLSIEDGIHEVAFMTSVSAREAGDDPKYKPVSVKLELARFEGNGRIKNGTNYLAPIGTPPLVEVGCFIEAPLTRVGRNSSWEVPEEGRPPRSWSIVGSETCGGLLCAKLMGIQQSEDWDRPRADRAAWRRRDLVWVSVQMGVAVKVERTIERRDPAHREPSHRSVTQYTLESRLRYPGKMFEDRKREVLQAKRFGDDAGPYLKQPSQFGSQIDALLRKVSYHLDNAPTTPYRKAVIHLAQRIDSARKGELLLVEHTVEEPPAAMGPLRTGQKVPDCVLADWTAGKNIRFTRMLGRPTLVMYYNPHTKTGVEVLTFAKELVEKMGDRISVAAMAVTNDREFARQQQAEMKLPFPILDGSAMRLMFQVEATPRFLVLDSEGYLRAGATGWAPHVGHEMADMLAAPARKAELAP